MRSTAQKREARGKAARALYDRVKRAKLSKLRLGMPPRVAAGAVVLLAALGAGLGVALGTTGAAVSTAATVGPTSPSSAVLSHYAVFRRPSSSSDALPPGMQKGGPSPAALSRRQPTPYASTSQWATLEGELLCVVASHTFPTSPGGVGNGASACITAEHLNNQLLVLVSKFSPPSTSQEASTTVTLISGLAPDGVTSVTLSFNDGSQQTVPVQENGFTYDLGESTKVLTSVTWTNPSGQTVTEAQ